MLYKFYADWCQPCKALSVTLNSMGVEYTDVNIDDPDAKALMDQFAIRSVPTLVDVHTGRKLIGSKGSAEISKWLELLSE